MCVVEGVASLDILDKKAANGGSILEETRDYDTMAYNDDMTNCKKMVISSEEWPSSEYKGLSSSSNESGNSRPPR